MTRQRRGKAGVLGAMRAGLLGLALLGPAMPGAALRAQPFANGAAEARSLAWAFLDRIGGSGLFDKLLDRQRWAFVTVQKRSGQPQQQAEETFDKYFLPEFRAGLPDLLARFEDILVRDFTIAELHSVVENRDDHARRSAAAKAGDLPAELSAAGAAWGSRIGVDVVTRNADALKALGYNPAAAPN